MSKLPVIICTHLMETNSNIASGQNQNIEYSLLSSSSSRKDLGATEKTFMENCTGADFEEQGKFVSLPPLCPKKTTNRTTRRLEPTEKVRCLVQRRHHKSLELPVDQFEIAPESFQHVQLRRISSERSSRWSVDVDPSRNIHDSSRNCRLSAENLHLSSRPLRRVVSDQSNISSNDKDIKHVKTYTNLSDFGTNNARSSYIDKTEAFSQELPAAWFSKVQRMPNGHENVNNPQRQIASQADNQSIRKTDSPMIDIPYCIITKPSQQHRKLLCSSRCQWHSASENNVTIGSSCSIKLAASCRSKNTLILKELEKRSSDTNLFWYSR